MTAEEAKALRSGDYVSARIGKRWVVAVFTGLLVTGPPNTMTVHVYRWGRGQRGKYPVLKKHITAVRVLPAVDRPTVWVHADYLDDHGHHEAAALLREAFPLPPVKEKSP